MIKISNIKYQISNIFRHPLFSGGLIMVGGNMAANAVNYLYHLVMGRILGPVDYGVLASLYSILYLVGIIPTSASVSIVKFISSAGKKEQYSIYWTINKFIFKLTIVVSIILFFISPRVSDFLRISNLGVVFLLSPILFLILLTLVNQATSQGILKFSGTVIPTLISAVAKLLLGFFFVYLGWSVFGAMIAIVIGAGLAYFYSLWFINKVIKKGKISEISLKPFWRYSFPVLIQALAFTSLFTVDVILVKHFFSPFEAGIYAALSILGKIIFFAASPITATMFPIVSGRKARGEGYRKIFLVSFVVTILLSVAIVVFYWLFPEIAIGILYGKAYLAARAELVWMGVFILFYTLSYLLVNFSLSLGRVRTVIFPLLVSLIQIPLIWFFHRSLLQVIQISLTLSVVMFVLLCLQVSYNLLKENEKA